jgi:hypothetical protein
MEWLVVKFPFVRDVFVDGRRWGQTNTRMVVGSGARTVHLGIPPNYRPNSWHGVIAHTTQSSPLVLTFAST